jgi:hypothetical protein
MNLYDNLIKIGSNKWLRPLANLILINWIIIMGVKMRNRFCQLILAIIVSAAFLLFTSCGTTTGTTTIKGSGNIVTESRSVSGYTALSFSGAGDLNITQDDTESLSITTDDNLMEYIETSVQGGTLHIEFSGGVSLDPSEGMDFNISVIELNSVAFSGAGSLEADSLIVAAATFDIEVSGVAECNIAGQVEEQNITASGTLTYDAADFRCSTATVDISGVGDVTVWVSDTFDVVISGVGDVYYWGSPAPPTIDISGVGNVEALGPKP